MGEVSAEKADNWYYVYKTVKTDDTYADNIHLN